jgi:hypothetical protein
MMFNTMFWFLMSLFMLLATVWQLKEFYTSCKYALSRLKEKIYYKKKSTL